jgi:hypothetical protein
MADQSYRAYRSRDPNANAGSAARSTVSDPLAELARLIGQSDPAGARDRMARRGTVQALDQSPVLPAERHFPDRHADTAQYQESRHADPRLGESYADGDDRDYEPEVPAASRSALRYPSFDSAEDDAIEDGQYADDSREVDSSGQLPALASQSDAGYETDQQWQETADGESYADDGYDEEVPGYDAADYEEGRGSEVARGPIRPSGVVLVLAVVALMGVGVAGAFAYHGMIGGKMFPSLPLIIKASDGPNKIVPKHTDAQADAAGQTGAVNGTGEKLVSREEQPLNIQTPPNTAPRVISTIPVLPDAGAAAQGVPPSVPVTVTPTAPAPAPLPQAAAPLPPAAPATASTEPKKVHTVVIRAGQSANAPMPTSTAARGAQPRAALAAAPRPLAAPRAEANAPLAIIPQQGGTSPPPLRTRIARAGDVGAPTETAPAAAQGGYSVQVSSQRSEAEAQAAFRALRAKFPTELGGREPMIRRADLGNKGTYYRALVGPYASVEQAAGVCSKIKAAGGTCLVQRN